MSQNVDVFPIDTPALRVEQPLGEFFVVSLPASVLLAVTYTKPLRLEESNASKGRVSITGTQREPDEKRYIEIARYIQTSEAAFPNSIILGANYTEDGRFLNADVDSDMSKLSWSVHNNNGCYKLHIPTDMRVAAIIDGQHRLRGFLEASPGRQSMELLCAVYLDLPVPYQAYLFATINFNQKRVDKSTAYQLFGFDIDTEIETAWPPEKLAVFLSRRLSADSSSPLRNRIKLVAVNRVWQPQRQDFQVSTATVVEGILSLISQNPKADRDRMFAVTLEQGRSRKLLSPDKSPLRSLFIAGEDTIIYMIIRNYFSAVNDLLWSHASPGSYICKTVGIQALFDILKDVCLEFIEARDLAVDTITQRLQPLSTINFSDNFFQASGKGRVRLRNSMRLALRICNIDNLPEADRTEYGRLVHA